VGNEWEYHFRHPLIHDVVYHSLLQEDRSALHEKTGKAIESMHSEKLDDYTDLLAHHYGHSDDVEKALHYLILAGDKAFKLASYWEALDYYGMAMEKAEGLKDEQRRKQTIVDLVLKRTWPRHWLGALKPDIAEHEKYLGLVEELADKDRTLPYYWILANHNFWMFEEFGKFKEYCEKIVSLGEDAVVLRVEKIFGKGYERLRALELFAKGRYEEAIVVSQQILEAVKTEIMDKGIEIPEKEVAYYITNPGNFLLIMAEAYAVMGHWSESLEACQTGLDVSVKDSSSSGIICGHGMFGNTYLAMGEWDKAIAELETALDMSPSGVGMTISGAILLGYAYCKVGQIDKGIALLERWKTYTKRVGRGAFFECEYSLPLAEGYLMQGDISKARMNSDEALRIALEHGYALHEAKAYRILGEIITPTDFPSADEQFSRSLEILKRIKARNEEGKTELNWGRACKQHGDIDQGKEHLTKAAEIFKELGTTRYLEWTQDFLAELT
jgi:tetratricopeptide (TPR) repeat protein